MSFTDAKNQKLRQDDFEPEGLMVRLPATRGALVPHASLAKQTWFHVGGAAEALFTPADEDDLSFFLANCPTDIPITILGVASNVLIRDGGIPGVVIKLGTSFSSIKPSGTDIVAGAAAVLPNVARTAQNVGIASFEFMAGIPGTVGGALRMNAGAHGSSLNDVLASAVVMDRTGKKQLMYAEQLGLSYRHCDLPKDSLFLEATFTGQSGDPKAIADAMKQMLDRRKQTQPIRERTCGSTFANPTDDPQNRKAWQLIELAGCRNLRIGDAVVSDKHANFLINRGNATAADIENLGEEIRRRVFETTGVKLRWEIQRLGVKTAPSASES